MDAPLSMRPYRPEDRQAVLGLLAASMGWIPDELSERYFSWKHEENAFGTSPAWVAVIGEQIVGFRTFMRWQFQGRAGGVVSAVRAVDTATHPDHQGRGIFSKLTRHAVDELRAQGVGLIFNTPNSKSQPGYLKLGWQVVGRPPVAMRPRSVAALLRALRSRVPAEKWSTPIAGGVRIHALLSQQPEVEKAIAESTTDDRSLRTARSVEYLRWRYGFEPLAYRAAVLHDDPSRGFAIYRLRRRGRATEAAICELVVPGGRSSDQRKLVASALHTSGADYALMVGARGQRPSGTIPMPGQGPVLTALPLTVPSIEPLANWQLALGDVELF
jgi:GNAT superfamily N-acetyltransferase